MHCAPTQITQRSDKGHTAIPSAPCVVARHGTSIQCLYSIVHWLCRASMVTEESIGAGVGWVNLFKGESIYPHVRAKFGHGPSRHVFNNR